MEHAIRTFIAVEIEPSLQQSLRQIQNDLNPLQLDASWVKPDNIHVTLRFLGELAPKKVKAITETFPDIFKTVHPFEINISGLGVFPRIERPTVLWAGIEHGDIEMKKLAAVLEEGLGRLGYPKERREFTTHLTLGRIRSAKNCDLLAEAIKNFVPKEPLRQTVRNIIFFKSTLSAQGSIYEPLAVAELT